MRRSISVVTCAMLIVLSGCTNSAALSSTKSELDELREKVASLRTENARLHAELNADRIATAFNTARFQLQEPVGPKTPAWKDQPQSKCSVEQGVSDPLYGKDYPFGEAVYGSI